MKVRGWALVAMLGLAAVAIWAVLVDRERADSASAGAREAIAGAAARMESSGSAPIRDLKGGGASDGGSGDRVEAAPSRSSESTPSVAATVSGRVVDAAGVAVGGARVIAAREPGLPMLYGNADGSLPVGRVEAMTDASGHYALGSDASGSESGAGFSLSGNGRLRLAVLAPGYAPFVSEDHPPQAVGGSELRDVVLTPGVSLAGHVRDEFGAAVAGARLRAASERLDRALELSGFRPLLLAETDAAGAFRIDTLAAGEWNLEVLAAGFAPGEFAGVADAPGAESSGVEFVLGRGAAIAGHVVGAPAFELARLQVRAEAAWDADSRVTVATLEADGSFVVEGLSDDTDYRLRLFEAPRHDPSSTAVGLLSRSGAVVAGAGETAVVLRYRLGSGLSFRAVDRDTAEPVESFIASIGRGSDVRSLSDEHGGPLRDHPGGWAFFDELGALGGNEALELTVVAEGYRRHLLRGLVLPEGGELFLGDIELERVPMIRVRVLDAVDRGPVAGASVSLTPDDGRSTAAAERRLKHAVLARWPQMLDVPGATELVVTGPDGRAELPGSTDQAWVLRVESRDHAPGEFADVRFDPGIAQAEREVLISPGGAVAVQAFDATGAPRVDVRVENRSPHERGQDRLPLPAGVGPDWRTDAEGRVRIDRLEPGLHGFRIAPGGGGAGGVAPGAVGRIEGPDEGDWTEILVVEGEVVDLELVESPKGTLRGIVLEGGAPLAGANLAVFPVPAAFAGPIGPAPRSAEIPHDARRSRTTGDGRFALDDLETGTYAVEVDHADRALPERFEAVVTVGVNDVEYALSAGTLRGRVTDPEGQPLAGVSVEARRAVSELVRPPAWSIVSYQGSDGVERSIRREPRASAVRTDGEGRFELRGVPEGKSLVALAYGGSHTAGWSEPVRLGDDRAQDLHVVLESGGDLRVAAFNADGSPAQSAIVEVWRLNDDGFEREVGYAAAGVAVVTGLAPGSWSVRILRQGPAADDDDDPRAEVSVAAGERTEIELRFP